jgi:hypothetical protein
MSKMNKLGAFIALDFKTIKPLINMGNLIFMALLSAVFSALLDTTVISVAIVFTFASLSAFHVFFVADRNGLDALYTYLGVERKTVVTGRFLYTLLFDLCHIAYAFLFAFAGKLIGRLLSIQAVGFSLPNINHLVIIGLMLMYQAINIPLLFKYGYIKSQTKSVLLMMFIPMVFIVLMIIAFIKNLDVNKYVEIIMTWTAENASLIGWLSLVVFAVTLTVSYLLSRRFYAKREF